MAAVAIVVAEDIAISYAVNMAIQALTPTQQAQGPRLADLRAQTATIGGGKAMFKGEVRVAGLMIFATPFIETATTTGGGGKGGGGGVAVTNYTYSQYVAIALGDVPILGIRKIWANGKLIYDVGDSATIAQIQASNAAQTWCTIYLGSETQTPNSWIQSYMATSQNQYYFIPSAMSIPDLHIQIGGGIITVAGAPVRQDVQYTTDFVQPVNYPRIDLVVINKTTGVISVLQGTESAAITNTQIFTWAEAGYAPSVPIGYYPICFVALNTAYWWSLNRPGVAFSVLQADILDWRVTAWLPNTQYYPLQYITNGTSLYVTKVGGVSGTTPLTGTAPIVTMTASIAASGALTVTAITGTLSIGMLLVGTGVPAGTQITSKSGTVWYTSCRVTVASTAITGAIGAYDGRRHPDPTRPYVASGGYYTGGVAWQYVEAFNPIPPVPTPAYRGTPYVMFYNYNLSFTGNTTPNFEFQLVEGTNDLGAIVTWASELAGLQASQLDVSQLTGTHVQGFSIANRSTARSMIEPLASAFFFDALESDGVIKYITRGGNLAVSIPELDLAAHTNGSQVPSQLTLVRKQEQDLPHVVTIQYPNQNNSYMPGAKYHRMQGTQSVMETTLQVPICMTDMDAQTIVNKLLNIAWEGRTSFSFKTGRKYAYYEPTDIVAVSKGAEVYEVRITNKDESSPGIITFDAVEEDVGLYSLKLNNLLSGITPPQDFNAPPGSVEVPLIIDAPGILTTSGFELWFAAGSSNVNWGGCNVYMATDNLNFTLLGTIHNAAAYGKISIPAWTADPDLVSIPVVDLGLSNTQLTSFTQADADNYRSLCYAGGELISYETATLSLPGMYQLSYLRRGVYNTGLPTDPDKIDVDFAFLDSRVFKYPYNNDLVGTTIYFKFPSFNTHGSAGEDIGAVATYSHLIAPPMGHPSNITGLAYSVGVAGLQLTWNTVADINRKDYELREGATWATAANYGFFGSNSALLPPQAIGSYTWWVAARDKSNNESVAPASIVVAVVQASAPPLTAVVSGASYILEWSVPLSDFAIDHYEIRTGSSWSAGTLLATVKGTTLQNPILFAGTVQFLVAAVDVAGNVGIASAASIVVIPPAAPTVTLQIIENNVLFYWNNTAQTLPLKTSEIRKGAVFATAQVIGLKSGLFTTVFESYAGVYDYWVVNIDTAGNYGTPTMVGGTVSAPPGFVLKADYNSNLLGAPLNSIDPSDYDSLYLTLSGNKVTQNSAVTGMARAYAIPQHTATYFEVTLGEGPTGLVECGIALSTAALGTALNAEPANTSFYYRPAGFIGTNGIEQAVTSIATASIGTVGVLVDMVNLRISFYMFGAQIGTSITIPAGTWCPAASCSGTVAGGYASFNFGATPFEYNVPVGANGLVNAFDDDSVLVLPINLTETWAGHFTSRSWASPQDQINAGYPLFAEPVLLTPGTYTEIIDYGTVLTSTKITITPTASVISGAPTVSWSILTSPDGVTWTTYANTTTAYASGFRYAKIVLTVTATAGTDLYSISGLNVKLSIQQISDSGSIACLSTDNSAAITGANIGGTTVLLNIPFIDIQSIVLTPQGTAGPVTAIYDYNPATAYPVGFKVYLYNAAGARVSGTVSWATKGF